MSAFTCPNSGVRKFHRGGRGGMTRGQAKKLQKLREEYRRSAQFTMTWVEFLKNRGVEL